MLVCCKCLKREARWADGSTKYNWCEKCVPRGCSCNNDYVFNERKEPDFNIKEQIKNILESYKKQDYILYKSNKGVKDGILDVSKCEYKKINKKLLKKKDFIKSLEINKEYSIKIIPINKNKKEYPCCCEVMYIKKEEILKKGEVLYSLKYDDYIMIDEIYQTESFRAYKISDNEKKMIIDEANPLYYPMKGIILDENIIDLLIIPEEVDDKEFKLLKNFIFKTTESEILKKIEQKLKKTKLNKTEIEESFYENNNDISFFFEEYAKTQTHSKINKKIKKEIIKNIYLYIKEKNKKYLQKETKEEIKRNQKISKKLFKLLVDFHKINEEIKYNDINDEYTKRKIKEREEIFKNIFKIIY
jgi:hypothetical protein